MMYKCDLEIDKPLTFLVIMRKTMCNDSDNATHVINRHGTYDYARVELLICIS